MRKLPVFLLPVLCAAFLLAVDQSKIPPMPAAVTGNAVASLRGGLDVFSLMGVGPKKTWDDVSNQVYQSAPFVSEMEHGTSRAGSGRTVGRIRDRGRSRRFFFSADTWWMRREMK